MSADKQVKWLNSVEAAGWRSLLEASYGLFDQLDAQLKQDHSITLEDYEVLHHLAESEDVDIRVGELSNKLIASRTRLTQRLDRLAERGLLNKHKCKTDARAVEVSITAKGKNLLSEAAPGHVSLVRSIVFDPLTSQDKQNFKAILRKVARQFRAETNFE